MERESFEDSRVAEFLNHNFVNVKVDRESLPDVDRCYMKFVQATNGHGGWPMSVWLTPDLKPFFGGTYFPPDDSFGRPSFMAVCRLIASKWKNNSDRIIASSNDIVAELNQVSARQSSDMPNPGAVGKALKYFANSYDSQYGGFGSEPKFPTTSILNFLLTYGRLHMEQSEMVEHTLVCISKGGIHDHIGGGFHRYSTDRYWHVPHFEKMLYDQAQLLDVYCDAYKVYPCHCVFKDTASDIIEYTCKNLLSRHGGFYSAQDADSAEKDVSSGKKEGAFAVWTYEDLERILGSDAGLFNYHFGVEKNGNVPSDKDPHGELTFKNVLLQKNEIDDTCKEFAKSIEEVNQIINKCKQTLLEERKIRPLPDLDDKIVLSWNALMISSLTNAYRTFQVPEYLEYARRSLEFIKSHLVDIETQLLKRAYRDEIAFGECGSEDYSFLIKGLVDFHQCTFEHKWLEWAIELQKKQDELFWDSERDGGYFSSKAGLVMRTKDIYDAAEPSSNAVSLSNLLRLHGLTANEAYRMRAEKLIRSFSEDFNQYPHLMPKFLEGFMIYSKSLTHITISRELHVEMKTKIFQTYLPHCIIEVRDNGGADIIICANNVCEMPINDMETLTDRLSSL